MTTPDVPATERERDELRERIAEMVRWAVTTRTTHTVTVVDAATDRILALLAPQGAREPARCQAVNFPRSMQCRLPARHGGEHIAGAGEGETRWTTEVADRLDASLAAARPAPEMREPDAARPTAVGLAGKDWTR